MEHIYTPVMAMFPDSQFYLDDILDESDNCILLDIRVGIYQDIVSNTDISAEKFVETYADNKKRIHKLLLSQLQPTISSDTLEAGGYPEPNNFVFKFISLNCRGLVRAYNDNDTLNGSTLSGELLHKLVLRIEDVSKLAPGESGADLVKQHFSKVSLNKASGTPDHISDCFNV